jgi:apolipoprotein N-acyltransferase
VEKLTKTLTRFPRLTALLSGAVSALGFVPWGLWPLTLLGFALLIYGTAKAKSRKAAFQIGWVFGVGHFTVSNIWIAITFTFQASMPIWLGYFAVVLLAFYLAIFPALAATSAWVFGDYVRRIGGKPTIAFALSFAGFWTVTEWVRSWLFTGYAWNSLSAVAIDWPGSGAMRAIGSYGLSGLIILISAILWGLIGAILTRQGKAIFARILDLCFVGLVCAFMGWFGAGSKLPGTQYPITITQPNISQAEKYDADYDAVNFSKLAALSRPAPNQGPRLLIWPEAAIPDYLESGYPMRFYQFQPGESAIGARMRLAQLLGPDDILLTGGTRLVIDKDGQLIAARNSMIAMDFDTKIRGSYDKSHLVPYGEYLPMPWLLKPLGLSRLVPGDLDFWPGPGAQTLVLGKNKTGITLPKIGLQICYEIIFSGQVADRANRPDFIINSSNDAWFGIIGPPQHLAQARMRALEEGLPVIRATPTGISAIIDADGRILKSLPLGRPGRIDGTLPPPYSPTLFARYGNLLSLIWAGLLLVFAFLPVVSRRSSR